MFFALIPIADHPCCRMQEVVEGFFLESIENSTFSIDLFPDWVRATLFKSTCSLSNEFGKVHDLLHANGIAAGFRRAIHDQLCVTNEIQKLCDGSKSLSTDVIDWKAPLGKAILALMLELYAALDLTVFRRANTGTERPTHQLYSEFIKVNKHICPFCGLNRFKNRRGKRREDFDHYLHKSAFPLAAANMKNLVPTCGNCNQDYKKAKNILADGAAFYPYSAIPSVELTIDCASYPAVDDDSDRGSWIISLKSSDPASSPKMSAWERVYSISERLRHEVLEHFDDWMEELRDEQKGKVDERQFAEILGSAKKSADNDSQRRVKPGQIIKAAFYEFMLHRADPNFLESYRIGMNAALD